MFVLFSSIQRYVAVAEVLFVYALIDNTVLRFTTAKLHQCLTRGKKSRGHINDNLEHLRCWSFEFKQMHRVLDLFDKVDTTQDKKIRAS